MGGGATECAVHCLVSSRPADSRCAADSRGHRPHGEDTFSQLGEGAGLAAWIDGGHVVGRQLLACSAAACVVDTGIIHDAFRRFIL